MAKEKDFQKLFSLEEAKDHFQEIITEQCDTSLALEELQDGFYQFLLQSSLNRENLYIIERGLELIVVTLREKNLLQTYLEHYLDINVNEFMYLNINYWSKITLLKFTNDLIKCNRNCMEYLNSYTKYILVDSLSTACTYELQTSILTMLFEIYEEEFLKKEINDFFPISKELRDAFMEIRLHDFHSSSRKFLNLLNAQLKKIFSIRSLEFKLDNKVLILPNNWIDINQDTRELSFYCGKTLVSHEEENVLHAVYIDLSQTEIDVYKISDTLKIQLKGAAYCSNSYLMRVINEAEILQIKFEFSDEYSLLRNEILPMVYARSKKIFRGLQYGSLDIHVTKGHMNTDFLINDKEIPTAKNSGSHTVASEVIVISEFSSHVSNYSFKGQYSGASSSIVSVKSTFTDEYSECL
ncbi:synaptonemal complex protein 2-like [Aethina tumida]|uniref:synaptonemal complex protein 2-like n=1 Tax=Aethina tumida TaxID=116153 RepID=UPI0021490C82|nr:synaptonemal complex protein 2-like [Aethina tumida]